MSQNPPNSLMCQECPYYKRCNDKPTSAFGAFLDSYNEAQKENAIKNGKYKEALKDILYGNYVTKAIYL